METNNNIKNSKNVRKSNKKSNNIKMNNQDQDKDEGKDKNKDTKNKNITNKNTTNKITAIKVNANKIITNKDTTNKVTKNKNTKNQDTKNKDTKNKVTKNQDTTKKDTTNKKKTTIDNPIIDKNNSEIGKRIGDTSYWFTNQVSDFSKKLFFPKSNSINLQNNSSIKSPFICKNMNINGNHHLQDDISINKRDRRFIKDIIKIINANIVNPTNLVTNLSTILTISKSNLYVPSKNYTINVLIKFINIIKNGKQQQNISSIDNSIINSYNTYVDTTNIIRAYRYEIILPKEKHNIITNWIKICNHFYNYLVFKYYEYLENPIESSIYSFIRSYDIVKAKIFEDYFSNILVKSNKEVIEQKIDITPISGKNKPIPYDMITDELRIFYSNLKSAKTNLKKGNIKKFEMGMKEYTSNSRSILLPKNSISTKGIFKNILGKQSNFNNQIVKLKKDNKIVSDSRLIYDYRKNKIYCALPLKKNIVLEIKEEQYVALDPGVNIFQTFYGEKTCGTMGENLTYEKKKSEEKIKRYEEIKKERKNKNNKVLKNVKKIERKINNIVIKYENKVKEFQNKIASYMCKRWDRIMIPKFRVSKIVKNGEGSINKEVKKNILSQRHYRFKQHIIHKSEEYGCKISLVEEDYTSQCCGNCGKLSKVYVNREKECPHCKIKINRDLNGAFNILIKNMCLL